MVHLLEAHEGTWGARVPCTMEGRIPLIHHHHRHMMRCMLEPQRYNDELDIQASTMLRVFVAVMC
eukprot:3428609-Prorocentrum_lima.AAC.1